MSTLVQCPISDGCFQKGNIYLVRFLIVLTEMVEIEVKLLDHISLVGCMKLEMGLRVNANLDGFCGVMVIQR